MNFYRPLYSLVGRDSIIEDLILMTFISSCTDLFSKSDLHGSFSVQWPKSCPSYILQTVQYLEVAIFSMLVAHRRLLVLVSTELATETDLL